MTLAIKSLRILAGVTSAISAAAAVPAAITMGGGTVFGVAIVSATAAVIYANWHYVSVAQPTTDSEQVIRAGAALTAIAFSAAVVFGIHTSAQLKAVDASAKANESAITLYTNQESSRMATLASLNIELRSTSKSKNPVEYAELQRQIDKQSTPTPKDVGSNDTAPPAVNGIYSWIVAASFEIVTPALLIIAGLFGRQRKRPQDTATATEVAQLKSALADAESKATATEHQLTATTTELTATRTATATEVAQLKSALADAESKATATEHQLTATTTELTATQTATASTVAQLKTALEALSDREVHANTDGNITANLVIDQTGCTAWQAKDAIRKATASGILIRNGEGNAARYTYATPTLRAVK